MVLDITTARKDKCRQSRAGLGAALGILLSENEIYVNPDYMRSELKEIKECGCPTCKQVMEKLKEVVALCAEE